MLNLISFDDNFINLMELNVNMYEFVVCFLCFLNFFDCECRLFYGFWREIWSLN